MTGVSLGIKIGISSIEPDKAKTSSLVKGPRIPEIKLLISSKLNALFHIDTLSIKKFGNKALIANLELKR